MLSIWMCIVCCSCIMFENKNICTIMREFLRNICLAIFLFCFCNRMKSLLYVLIGAYSDKKNEKQILQYNNTLSMYLHWFHIHVCSFYFFSIFYNPHFSSLFFTELFFRELLLIHCLKNDFIEKMNSYCMFCCLLLL